MSALSLNSYTPTRIQSTIKWERQDGRPPKSPYSVSWVSREDSPSVNPSKMLTLGYSSVLYSLHTYRFDFRLRQEHIPFASLIFTRIYCHSLLCFSACVGQNCRCLSTMDCEFTRWSGTWKSLLIISDRLSWVVWHACVLIISFTAILCLLLIS